MSATDQFFTWYFEGFEGIGGWLLFLLLAMAAVVWLFYDSQTRRIRALGWQMGAILVAVLVLPTLVYRFVSLDTRATLDPFKEVFFYLGLLGGIIPAVIAAGYFVSFRGMVGCDKGHVYESTLPKCPVCEAEAASMAPAGGYAAPPPLPPMQDDGPTEMPQVRRSASSSKKRAGAWLVDSSNNHRYELFVGDTRVGRKSDDNDVVIHDPAISKEHALIREANGHFTVYDRGSATGTLVNGKRLRGPMMLENGDEITIGDTTVRFVSSQ